MNNNLYREYKFKFYLNFSHYITIDGKEGQIHPHTWEFTINVHMDSEEFVQFGIYENEIDKYFDKYQNCLINEIKPFDTVTPTLENISDYFVSDIRQMVANLGGILMKMESSETPTRSYVISFKEDAKFVSSMKKNTENKIDKIIDSVLDGILD